MYQFMPTRNQADFQERMQSAMEREGIDTMILTTPYNIFYATGYLPSFLYDGRSSIGSDIAVVNRQGKVALTCSQFLQGGAELQTKGDVEVIPYPSWIFIEDYFDANELTKEVQPDMYKTFRIALGVADRIQGTGKIAIESSQLPHDKYVFLAEHFGEDRLIDAGPFMTRVRTIKFPWEIDVLRYSAQVAEKMMNHVMTNTEIGMCEADLMKMWYQSAYEITGGHELFYAIQAHTPGPDFWATALPRETPLQNGDVVRLDGGVNIYGYYSDLGRTYVVGDHVAPEKQAIFDTLLAARDTGLALMKPGNRFADVFHAVMKVCKEGALPQYVRGHCGHTIGVGVGEEYPMLSPDSDLIFEPGMVFCFETPYYSSKYNSYNLEDTLVITETGHELFTDTNRSLFVK